MQFKRVGDTVQILDRGSLNGTWVNEERIPSNRWITVTPDAEIILGASECQLKPYDYLKISPVMDVPKKESNDYRREFEYIARRWHEAKKERDYLERKQQRLNSLMNIAVTIGASLLTIAITPFLQEPWKAAAPLLSTFPLIARFIFQPDIVNYKDKLRDIDTEVSLFYKCPGYMPNKDKCNRSFGSINTDPRVISEAGRCDKCKAQYN
jgi:hypothetical protein